MHNIWIPTTNQTIEFAECIEELTNEQYLYYCQLLSDFMNNKYTFFEVKVLLVYKLLNMKIGNLKKETELATRNQSIFELTEAVESLFLIEKNKKKYYVNPAIGFVENKLPTIKIGKVVYYGPGDMFMNITFKEHMQAYYQYSQYVATKEECYLDELLAILYRPGKPETEHNLECAYDGDKRKPYYPYKSAELVSVFKTLDFKYKFAVYLWFQSVQEYVCTATDINVIGNPCNFSVLFQESKTDLKGIGMPGVLFDLVKTAVIGNKKETENELYLFVLLALYKQHIDAENIKKQNKNATK